MDRPMHILMTAAENDGIRSGKVGGIGDVIRDAPAALARRRCRVSVITPSYGFLQTVNQVTEENRIGFYFAGAFHRADLYRLTGKIPDASISHWVIDHPALASRNPVTGDAEIYSHDQPESPFARDATKFALFCSALSEAIKKNVFGKPDCIHLHDWHSAFFLLLREYHPAYAELKRIRTVFTIHNLSLQGVRPLHGHASSLERWYPGLSYAYEKVADPRWDSCINPMGTAIRLADAVHAVSPSYAEEITRPSFKTETTRYYGGEGLERDISEAGRSGRLFGILNGCEYGAASKAEKPEFIDALEILSRVVSGWIARSETVSSVHFLAHTRLTNLLSDGKKPETLLTAVARITEQKMLLLKHPTRRFASALEAILNGLGPRNTFILLGTGDSEYERFLVQASAAHTNFIYLSGYSDDAAEVLYRSGDLFLMPSSFEPCGISQMLAMREGQPCVVHRVGGLKDTVRPGVNGFGFDGEGLTEQAENFVSACHGAIRLKETSPREWEKIRLAAAEAEFSWDETASAYIDKLYTPPEAPPTPVSLNPH